MHEVYNISIFVLCFELRHTNPSTKIIKNRNNSLAIKIIFSSHKNSHHNGAAYEDSFMYVRIHRKGVGAFFVQLFGHKKSLQD